MFTFKKKLLNKIKTRKNKKNNFLTSNIKIENK
jgi:hypothetical protein